MKEERNSTWKLMTWRQIDFWLRDHWHDPITCLTVSLFDRRENCKCWAGNSRVGKNKKINSLKRKLFAVSSAFALMNADCFASVKVTNKFQFKWARSGVSFQWNALFAFSQFLFEISFAHRLQYANEKWLGKHKNWLQPPQTISICKREVLTQGKRSECRWSDT